MASELDFEGRVSSRSKLCWPIAVRSLAASRDTRFSQRGTRKTWMLDIAGSFCIPGKTHPHLGSYVSRLADTLSNLLALPVSYQTRRGAITFKVEVSDQELDRVFGDEYRGAVSAVRQGYRRKTKETRNGK